MKKFLIALATTGFAGLASANVISTEVNITATNPGSVAYVNFSVSSAGHYDIRASGYDSLGLGYNWDPAIYLFRNSLANPNLIGKNDDISFDNWDSLISNISLGVGNYIVAVSEYEFSLAEAISGANAWSINDPGLIRVTISSRDDENVPEPASLALASLGLFGLAVARRRRSK